MARICRHYFPPSGGNCPHCGLPPDTQRSCNFRDEGTTYGSEPGRQRQPSALDDGEALRRRMAEIKAEDDAMLARMPSRRDRALEVFWAVRARNIAKVKAAGGS